MQLHLLGPHVRLAPHQDRWGRRTLDVRLGADPVEPFLAFPEGGSVVHVEDEDVGSDLAREGFGPPVRVRVVAARVEDEELDYERRRTEGSERGGGFRERSR